MVSLLMLYVLRNSYVINVNGLLAQFGRRTRFAVAVELVDKRCDNSVRALALAAIETYLLGRVLARTCC